MTVQLSSLKVSAELDASKYVQGAQQKVAADQAMTASDKAAAASVQQTQVRLAEKATAVDKLARALDPAIAAQAKFEAGQKTINSALDRGKISQQEAARLQDLLAQKYMNVSVANDNLAKSTKLTFQQQEILRSGVINTVQSLAAGMDPLRTFETQITQTAPALIGMNAGLIAVTLGVAAVTAVVGGGIYAIASYRSSIDALTRANSLMGGATGETVSQLNQLAVSAAAAGNISVAAARDQVTSYTLLGKIGPDVMRSLITLSRDYAKATGQDLAGATKDLGGLFRDPAKGAQELSDKFGLLSDKELQHIRNLSDMGQRTAAQKDLAAALTERIKGQADQVGYATKAWEALKNAVSGTLEAIGKIGAPGTLDDQIKSIEAKRAALAKSGLDPANLKAAQAGYDAQLGPLYARRSVENYEAGIAGAAASINEKSIAAGNAARSVDPLYARRKELDDLSANMQAGIGTGTDGAANLAANIERVENARKTLMTDTEKSVALSKAEAAAANLVGIEREKYLARARAEIETSGQLLTSKERQQKIEAAVAGVTAGVTAAMAQQAAVASRTVQQTNAVADAYMKSTEAGVRAEAERQAAIESVTTGVPVATRALQLMAEKTAQAAEEGAKQVDALNLQADAADKASAAELQGAAAVAEVARQNDVAAFARSKRATINEASSIDDIKRINDEIKAYDALTKRILGANEQGAANRETFGLDRQIADNKTLIDALKQGNLEYQKQAAYLQELHRLEDIKGKDGITPDDITALKQKTDELAKQNVLTGNLRAANDSFKSAAQDATETLFQGFEDAVIKGNSLRDVVSGLAQDLQSILLRAAILKPIERALDGAMSGSGTEGTGWVGDLVGAAGRYFGGGSGGTLTGSEFAGLTSYGGGGFAKGGAWSRGVRFLASGGLLDRPTFFTDAGGRANVAGEAGTEAVMPLARGPDGNLGVRLHGAAANGNTQIITIDARGADAGVETRIRQILRSELPQWSIATRQAAVGDVQKQAGMGGSFAKAVGRRRV